MRIKPLYAAAGALVVLLIAATIWLVTQTPGEAVEVRFERPITATNPTLDVRFRYDGSVFELQPFDPGAEYPLRLEADGWGIYGKRIGGMGAILRAEPRVYDYLTSMHDGVFRDYYELERAEDPVYEDIQIGGHPALHTVTHYIRPPDARGWPSFFPEEVQSADEGWVEGWVVMTDQDLYFFYAASAERLTAQQRALAQTTLDGIQFGAILGGAPAQVEE